MSNKKYPSLTVDIPNTGYIAAYRTNGSLINKLIVKKQLKAGFSKEASQYTHVEVIGIKLKDIRYSINISFPKAKPVDMFKHHKGRYVKILRYKNSHYEKWGRAKIAWLSATKCNTKYDISGIFAFVFKWVKHNSRLWFCSEGVAEDFKTIYPELFIKPSNKIMPADFVASSAFEIAWQGKIG